MGLKLLENIVAPHERYRDCEIGFIAAFSSLYMTTAQIPPPAQRERPGLCSRFLRRCVQCGGLDGSCKWIVGAPSIHQCLATISGIALAQPDLSRLTGLEDGRDAYFINVLEPFDDYIGFLCRCAGYTPCVTAHGAGKEAALETIRRAVDRGRPAIIQFGGAQWRVVAGYHNDTGTLYTLKEGVTLPNEDPVLKHVDEHAEWFDSMCRIVTLGERLEQPPTHKEVFARLYRFMKSNRDSRAIPNSMDYLLNDRYFAALDDAGLAREQQKLENLFFGLVIMRCNVGWYCENPYELNNTNWGTRFEHEFNQISFAQGVNHDLGHISNGSILGNRPDFRYLKDKTARSVLANVLNVVDMQNCRMMSMFQQISKK